MGLQVSYNRGSNLTNRYVDTEMSVAYILIEDVNDYNQYGSYLRGLWINKPSKEELLTAMGIGERGYEIYLNGHDNFERFYEGLTDLNGYSLEHVEEGLY